MNEEYEYVLNSMRALRVPEDLQDRVLTYYERLKCVQKIRDSEVDKLLSEHLGALISTRYFHNTIKRLSFHSGKYHEIIEFAEHVTVQVFVQNDVIIKELEEGTQFFFIKEGKATAI